MMAISQSRNLQLLKRNNNIGVIKLAPGTKQSNGFGNINALNTPLSPSSKYTTSYLKKSDHSIISAVLFSYWDNILGPRLYHVWCTDSFSIPSSSILMYVCGQVLNGEICRDPMDSQIDYKFYNMPDKGIIVMTFVFSAKGRFGQGVHSVSFIIPNSETKYYLEIHELLRCWFQRMIGKIRILLNKDSIEAVIIEFSRYLTEFMVMLGSLQEGGLNDDIQISETVFCPNHVIEEDFFRQVLTSHLMTFGRTLVIGKSMERVNLIIKSLALFNSKSECHRSREVLLQKQWPYHHDLCIQGQLKGPGDVSIMPVKEILCSMYPTTIIDIANRDVKQSPSCHDHLNHQYQTLKDEMICLHYNQEQSFTKSGMFTSSDLPETLVGDFLKRINLLQPSCGARQSFIAQFLRFLQRKALCLIKFIEAETKHGLHQYKGGIRTIRQAIGLRTDGDFYIVLAVAEKLNPGLCYFLLGDKEHDFDV